MKHCTKDPSGIETLAGVTWLVVDIDVSGSLIQGWLQNFLFEQGGNQRGVNRSKYARLFGKYEKHAHLCYVSRNFIGNDTAAAIQQSLSYPPLERNDALTSMLSYLLYPSSYVCIDANSIVGIRCQV